MLERGEAQVTVGEEFEDCVGMWWLLGCAGELPVGLPEGQVDGEGGGEEDGKGGVGETLEAEK